MMEDKTVYLSKEDYDVCLNGGTQEQFERFINDKPLGFLMSLNMFMSLSFEQLLLAKNDLKNQAEFALKNGGDASEYLNLMYQAFGKMQDIENKSVALKKRIKLLSVLGV